MPEDLRTEFVKQACEAFYDAFDNARPLLVERTWPALTEPERSYAMSAMSTFLDWLDSRRL